MSSARPLSSQEELRLSTCSNFVTLALFRPLDTHRIYAKLRKESGAAPITTLWGGWAKQALNKAVDDEVFNSNIARVTNFVEENLNIQNPGKTPAGKAAVGVAARALTLTFTVPFQTLLDKDKRGAALADKTSGFPLALYKGFEKSLVKESLFTASYVMSSAYFGNMFAPYRPAISARMANLCNKARTDKATRDHYTDVAVAAMKASAAGAFSSVLCSPIDMRGKNLSFGAAGTAAVRKALRKGCYNAINTVIVQTLYSTKIHRHVLQTLMPVNEEKETQNVASLK